ncbi:MAG: acetate--CoA ligase [Candidatus Woesearchaeota archaeon]
MQESRKFQPSKRFCKNAYIKSEEEYNKMYKESIKYPEKFWSKQAEEAIYWEKRWKTVFTWDKKRCRFTWFKGGKLNVCYNCVDRHLEIRGNKIALISEQEGKKPKKITYNELHKEVCKFANVLKKYGLKKGDKVLLYMPMILELPIAMLACTRIGIIHSIVFGGFSADAIYHRLEDSKAKLIITADGSYRRGKYIDLKKNVDDAIKYGKSSITKNIKKVIVVKNTKEKCCMKKKRDVYWHDEIKNSSVRCDYEYMDAEDPLFILYTSGTTGKPKGVLHTTAGYLLYVNQTFKYIFDYHEKDVFWCTADIGWITGHSYIVYGPLSNGATSILFDGVPDFPIQNRWWEIIEKHKVTQFYTAPTAVRMLIKLGTEWTEKNDLSSLRLLGSVGEPINPEAWMWYHKYIGKGRCPIVDTWWQTETGGILITPLPGATILKPGSATRPFFGIDAAVINQEGKEAKTNEGGNLVIKKPWPGLMRTVYGDHKRYVETYFSQNPPYYFTSDGARRDEDGDFWLMGRIDDVINVSGHRIGTAEVESALVSHKGVSEAAVVPMPHDIKGQGLYAFVTLKNGIEKSEEIKKELIQIVKKNIGSIAKPDKIQFAEGLPKTRSGKIMRRILRKIAEGVDKEGIGNTTTLADPNVVDNLLAERI